MKKNLNYFKALLPIIFLSILLSVNVVIFEDSLSGPNQLALLLAGFVGALIIWWLGGDWDVVFEGVLYSIGKAMPSVLILLFIGSLVGTWLISGTVPTLIYYGLNLLRPEFFLPSTVIICAIVSVITGSSWSTIATIGVALLGVGDAFQFDKAIVAGAVISGAYFGDKISPLSDTTNLASSMAGTDLFKHIRYMMFTTVPSILISLLIFTFIGAGQGSGVSMTEIEHFRTVISESVNVTPWLLLVPVSLFVIIALKTPALPALMIGSLVGCVCAIIFQPELIEQVAGKGHNLLVSSYKGCFTAMFEGFRIDTTDTNISELLSTAGMQGMLNTVWLILSAMFFGGVMEGGGLLQTLVSPLVKKVTSAGGLVTSTVVTCIFFNIVVSDQYLAIVVPGRLYSGAFRKRGLAPEVLSRSLEDSGTITSVLVPWNSCGATQAKVLGVATLSYLPYCFFNLLSPLMSIIFAVFNIRIRRNKF
ncbi:MAG: Na+/H+ antiporter NhaC [Bacteroidales bacterium]